MRKTLPYILIIVCLLLLGGMYLQISQSKMGKSSILDMLPANKTAELENQGAAPEFAGIQKWLNSEPLTLQSLRGKVVLIDFWTYSCINCVRTLPYVTKWYDTYKDQGFVVIGVHTPEFAFEKETKNVETAIKRHKINYPVAQDNNFGTWNAYNNLYWPAHYLIDQKGDIVYTHFGEGKYEETENAIRTLLGMNANTAKYEVEKNYAQTPEIYFGTKRIELLDKDQQLRLLASSKLPPEAEFTLPENLRANTFAMDGSWQFAEESAKLLKAGGKIQLHFSADKVFMVAKSEKLNNLTILVDGKKVNDVSVQASDLYQLFDAPEPGEHVLEIQIPEAGFEAFTFTFG